MFGKILNLALALISLLGIFAAVYFFYAASRPCGSDGCMIRLYFIPGSVCLLIFIPLLIMTYQNHRRGKRTQQP
jgi:hypothetical protein